MLGELMTNLLAQLPQINETEWESQLGCIGDQSYLIKSAYSFGNDPRKLKILIVRRG